MKFKKAFTLAEVLITLSIIAIIAILTVPALVKNYKNKLYAASIEKVYSQLTDAVQSVVNDEMATSFSKTTAGVQTPEGSTCENAEAGVCWFMRNYLKVANGMVDCTSAKKNTTNGTNKKVCVADSYYTPDGNGPVVHFGECVQTTNGATICMSLNAENGVISVFVDTNGPSQPNMTGIDVFIMDINGSNNSVVDWSNNPATCNTAQNAYSHIGKYAPGCLTKIMNAGWKIED